MPWRKCLRLISKKICKCYSVVIENAWKLNIFKVIIKQCVCVFVCACLRACLRVCLRACLRACTRVRACVCVKPLLIMVIRRPQRSPVAPSVTSLIADPGDV